MKTQEELNNDYDKIMIEFQQKYFIESSLKIERRYDEKDIGNVFNKFSNYFNEEYQHIYLKPLLLLNKDPRNNDKTSFLNAVENLPSTFFNTAMGEEFVISHSHAFARNLLLLPITEEREAMLFHKKHLEDPYRESFETLSKNEQINIQENLSDFVDIFLHSDKCPESIKHKCLNILLNEIKDFVSGNNNSYSNPFKLNKFKHTDFLIDVFQSIEFQNPFKELNANFFQREFNSSRKPFSIWYVMSNVNHFINVVHSILKDNKIHSLNDLHSSFFSLSEKEKLEVYEEVDHLDNSLLMSAIEYSNSPLAFKLLDFGFDPNKPNINGVNPLINSIKYSQEDLALHLVDITNDLDFARFSNGKKNGDTALIYACNKDMPQVVKKLIEHGADPFYTNEFYQHALFYCIRNTEPALECFKYLFPIYNHKASSINILGNSIIEIIFRYGQIEHLETIAYHKIEFNDLNQEKINELKVKTSTSWANILNGAKGNSLDEFLILVNYWDKMKDMIKLQNKFINKEKHKEKNTIPKI